jgi:tRNA threonylcarbamoyladenosine biosynthesis protein TsaB
MVVLGFDTSTSATAVALRLADGSTAQARDDPAAGAHPGHATRLLELVDGLLTQADVGWSAVTRVAVGVGPGTFTGLRVGVATARGLAQSLQCELVGVSSTRALALPALAEEPMHGAGSTHGAGATHGAESTQGAGSTHGGGSPEGAASAHPAARASVLAVIDARRGEVFAAAYELGEPGVDDGGERVPRELSGPAPLAPGELAGVVSRVERAAGGQRRWLAVGDGALRYRDQLELAGIAMPPDASPLHLLSAAAVCELGARAPAAGAHETLPDYRRRPDAELALAGVDEGPLR